MSILDRFVKIMEINNKVKFRMPCLKCGKNDSIDCGYGEKDYWGEFS